MRCLGKFDASQAFIFTTRIDSLDHLREEKSHRLALFFVNRELLGEVRRKNIARAQRVIHGFAVSRQPRLDGLD